MRDNCHKPGRAKRKCIEKKAALELEATYATLEDGGRNLEVLVRVRPLPQDDVVETVREGRRIKFFVGSGFGDPRGPTRLGGGLGGNGRRTEPSIAATRRGEGAGEPLREF